MEQRKQYIIPNSEYIDTIPELLFIPVDEFAMGVTMPVIMMWIGFPLLLVPVVMGITIYIYRKFKKKYTSNFYLYLPYMLGFREVKGLPDVTVKEMRE